MSNLSNNSECSAKNNRKIIKWSQNVGASYLMSLFTYFSSAYIYIGTNIGSKYNVFCTFRSKFLII